MGIRGLATYIRRDHSHCLHDYELQNTYLVIDGNNICYRIYDNYVDKTSSLFGGDYYAYEQAILNFFDSLLACEVTPLVLLDGADEILKIGTTLKRCKQRYDSILSGEVMPPLHSLTILKQALRKKNIRHAQCLFEADKTIAAVAKILKCPVLSNDSDFYMHGALYIPFDNTFHCPVNRSSDNEKVIRCKLYDYKHLLNSFKGLNHHTLSLTALILGDEKMNLEMLRNSIARSPGLATNTHIIQKTFNWLSERTVEKAITDILSGIRHSMRQQTLDIIESVINDYTCINLPAEVCGPLSIPEYTMDSTKIYKFKGDIENIPFIRIRYKRRFETTYDNKREIMEIKNMLIAHRNAQNGNDSNISKVPTWFKHEVSTAKVPGILLNYIDTHVAIFPVQIEDVKRPPSSLIALNIVSVIYGIMSSIVDHKKTYMKYVIRDVNMNLICNELEGTRTVCLSSLRELPIIERKDILDDTLGVKDMKYIAEFLPEWKLYIACIKYWSDQQMLYKSDKRYAYSIILCILYRICCTTKNKGEAHDGEPNCSENMVVVEAYRKIDATNSTSAVQYFTRHSQAQKRILYKRQVDWSIVHAFAQFQMCLLYAIDLNTLLGCPYEEPLIADLFDGTLLYNLYTDLQAHEDIPKYINQVFKDSPTILAMFNILMLRVDLLLK